MAAAALSLAGCGQAPSPTFVLNEKTLGLVREGRDPVEQSLKDNFGTPNELVAWEKFPIDYGKADAAQAGHETAGWKLKEGRNLYMTHCLHCHGTSGDGDGPTARFLNPRPRDFRDGVFKFTSTLSTVPKPSRGDLKRTLEQGIPGTYMPSFVLLGDAQLDAIIEYVRWLSTRGQFEIRLANEIGGLGATRKDVEKEVKDSGQTRRQIVDALKKTVDEQLKELVDTVATDVADAWTKGDAEDSVVLPKVKRTPATAKTTMPVPGKSDLTSIQNGRELFLSAKAKCVDCHGPSGRGDGRQTEDYGDIPGTNQKYAEPGLHDIPWGRPQQPRDLTRGIYRGGRRPLDLYRRIFAGIKGTQMPAFGVTVLKDEEIWDIVNYVMSIPYDGKSPEPPSVAADKDKENIVRK